MNKRYNITNLEEIIEMFDLRSKNRYQPFLYRRYYLYYVLHSNGYRCTHIGQIFKKDHSSVLHGLKVHEVMMEIKDKYYQMFIDELDQMMDIQPSNMQDLKKDVLLCKTIKQLQAIKDRINLDFYTFVSISFLIYAL